MTTKDNISELVPSDIHEMLYIPVAEHEEWRIELYIVFLVDWI